MNHFLCFFSLHFLYFLYTSRLFVKAERQKKKALENIGFLCLTFIDVKVHLIVALPYSYALKKRTTGICPSTFYQYKTRPDTRHKMHLVCVLFPFENNTGHTDGRTDGPTDGRTDRRTDTTSYRDATAHLKRKKRRKVREKKEI